MNLDPSATYLEAQVATATPQRLRLMLIEGALRHARAARAEWAAGRLPAGSEAAVRCREIIGELIAGIHPDQTAVAKQVLGVYLFLFSSLTEAQLACDLNQLGGIIRVLEEERATWTEVCHELPERVTSADSVASEELAPQLVGGGMASYGPSQVRSSPASAGFSIEA